MASHTTFRDLIERLDENEFVRFCASLWAARGYNTTVEDNQIVLNENDPTIETRILVPVGPADLRVEESRVDTVVSARIGECEKNGEYNEIRYISLDELQQIALYAIDRETADSIFYHFFNQSVETVTPQGSVESKQLSQEAEVNDSHISSTASSAAHCSENIDRAQKLVRVIESNLPTINVLLIVSMIIVVSGFLLIMGPIEFNNDFAAESTEAESENGLPNPWLHKSYPQPERKYQHQIGIPNPRFHESYPVVATNNSTRTQTGHTKPSFKYHTFASCPLG